MNPKQFFKLSKKFGPIKKMQIIGWFALFQTFGLIDKKKYSTRDFYK